MMMICQKITSHPTSFGKVSLLSLWQSLLSSLARWRSFVALPLIPFVLESHLQFSAAVLPELAFLQLLLTL
jgi:hypothetical protein